MVAGFRENTVSIRKKMTALLVSCDSELLIHHQIVCIKSMDLYYLTSVYQIPALAINLTSFNVWCHLQFATTRRDFLILGQGFPPNFAGDTGMEQLLLPMQACFTTDSDDLAWQLPLENFVQSPAGFP